MITDKELETAIEEAQETCYILDGTKAVDVGYAWRWGYTQIDAKSKAVLKELNRRAMEGYPPLTQKHFELLNLEWVSDF